MDLPASFNVTEYFVDRNLAEGRGDLTAVFFGDRELTYRQIAASVNQAANAFLDAGVRPQDRVLLALHDSPAFATAFWGAIKMGAVALPVNTFLAADDYDFMLQDSGARCVVVQDCLFEKVAPALRGTSEKGRREKRKAGNAPAVLVAGAAAPASFELRTSSFEQSLARAAPQAVTVRTHRDDPAFWLYTSGSTGRPKAAIHRHRDMLYCFENYARGVLRISAGDRTFSASKLFFAYGLGNALYFPFGAGAQTVLVPERASAEKVFEQIARYRPTIFYGVPSLYAAMLQVAEPDRFDLSSLRCAVSAGEALPATLWERFHERFGISILDGIGSTEMLHMFLSNRLDDIVPGSSGRMVPGYRVKIVDDESREVPPGEMGSLWVQGGSAAAGYWNRPGLTEATFLKKPDGEWTVTGDKYRNDEGGHFWYCGRADDMLKVHGLWVSPLEIESALLAHPAVVECAVVRAIDRDGLDKPKAFVVLKEGAPPSAPPEDDLIAFLKTRLPGYKVPTWLVVTESLPKTSTGKIQRYKLRQ